MIPREGVSQSALELQGQQNLTQRLMMSAHMQQAIHLLQLPIPELELFIEEQVVVNPILEIEEEHQKEEIEEENSEIDLSIEKEIVIHDQDFQILKNLDEDWRAHFAESDSVPLRKSQEHDKYKTYLESSICAPFNLSNQLIQQARDSFTSPLQLQMAEVLIGYIDQYGFLKNSLIEIALLHHFQEEDLKNILKEIQTFEPYGVGASSIQESLLIQLRLLHQEKTIAYQIVKNYYNELLHNRIPMIQKSLKCSFEEIQQAINRISKLDLHPGTQCSTQTSTGIIPDVILRQEGDQLIVEVNRDDVPGLRLNDRYLKMLEDPEVPLETKQFIRRHIFSAKWLMRNLQQRHSTLERITQSLAKRQYLFFTDPEGQLTPLTMKALAEELEVHESTIARTVANKYLASPRGLFPLRAFFTTAYFSETGKELSSKTVRESILEMIKKENKHQPLSDEMISQQLKNQGISCARRTVTKHRLALQIGNTLQRKKFSNFSESDTF
jgi:RNA polymerase sigma-54 factor